jgi:hypothetical protein
VAGIALTILAGLFVIADTHGKLTQTYDEPLHLGTGTHWLHGRPYDVDPKHPPLARAMAAYGARLAGGQGRGIRSPEHEGNAVLHSGTTYTKVLTAARRGTLPFFAIGALGVVLWAWRLAGPGAGLSAVALFSTLPSVLAHAGLVTTDMAGAATLPWAVLAFVVWLRQPSVLTGTALGIAVTAALMTKFSALVFLPACLAVAWPLERLTSASAPPTTSRRRWTSFVAAVLVCGIAVWATYRFEVSALTDAHHRPHRILDRVVPEGRLRDAAYYVIERPWVPAADVLRGIADLSALNSRGHLSYFLGEAGTRGWWSFFPIVLLVKTPLPFLLLVIGGALVTAGMAIRGDRTALLPLGCALAIVVAASTSRVTLSVRHVLPAYPFLAVVAGIGAWWLAAPGPRRPLRLALLALLAAWQVASLRGHPDHIAYFNELAGARPERIVVDADLDWGQDLERLVVEVRQRGIEQLSLAYFGSADVTRHGLPAATRPLAPHERVSGWVAVSKRFLKVDDSGIAPYDGYAWLEEFTPVAVIGNSMLLYHIADAAEGANR